MSRHPVKSDPVTETPPGRRPDRWSAMAMALDPDSHASTPSAAASRFSAGRMPLSEAASLFGFWSAPQRLEFASAVAGSASTLQKHRLASALPDAVPEVLSLLSFKPLAEEIAMGHAVESGSTTPNTIIHELERKYPDSSLKAVLAQAFEEASALCEPSRRKFLLRVAKGLKDGNGRSLQ